MKIPIVFSFDDRFALPACIALKSLIDSKEESTEYEVIVLIDKGFSHKSREAIESICPVRWVSVPPEVFQDVPMTKNWNRNTYYRLLVPSLFPEHDKIIWSDVDVLFRKDLACVYDIDLGDAEWAGVAAEVHEAGMVCHDYRPENPNRHIFWPGFMIYNVPCWKSQNTFKKCCQVVEQYGDALRFCDLDVLNLACRNIAALPLSYCVLETISDWSRMEDAPEYAWLAKVYSAEEIAAARTAPTIIHYAGINPKVWNRYPNEIPSYYWDRLVQAPLFDREFYFPGVRRRIWSCLMKIAYKLMPIKRNREALKKAWRFIMCANQYQRKSRRKG